MVPQAKTPLKDTMEFFYIIFRSILPKKIPQNSIYNFEGSFHALTEAVSESFQVSIVHACAIHSFFFYLASLFHKSMIMPYMTIS